VLYPAELHAHNSSIIANALMLVKCLVKNFAKKMIENFPCLYSIHGVIYIKYLI
jgi:hypothetical protein